jgi:hypothetical protein
VDTRLKTRCEVDLHVKGCGSAFFPDQPINPAPGEPAMLGIIIMDIQKSRDCFKQLLIAVKNYCQDGSPLPFVLGAAFIDYYSKMVKGCDEKGPGYKEFIVNYMQKVRKEYQTFTYLNTKDNLPEQMWHVMRCGLVHTFSLFPDKSIKRQPGRDRSIVLCHKTEAAAKGLRHLSHYLGPKSLDAAVFVAEDFIDDLIAVNDLIFDQASSGSVLKDNIEKWLKQCPPISGGF